MSYLGAKSGSGVYQAIINLMPPHETYVEPFFGSGAIMWQKSPAIRNVAIDLEPGVILEHPERYRKKWPEVDFDFYRADAIRHLQHTDYDENTLIYCDPPYVHATRTSNKRYRFEFSDDQHRELLTLLKSLNSMVMLSGYRNPIYDELINDWFSVDFQAMTRGGVRTETVWCNFEPSEVHYHTYVGKDFTDRQRIKRKAERWANRFKKLPAGERQAVLSAILSISSDHI